MKNLLLGLGFLAFLGCQKNADRVSILVPLRPVIFEFPAGSSPADTYHFYLENQRTDVLDAVEATGRTWADVTAVEGADAVFEADFLDAEYRWFEEVSVRVYQSDRSKFLEAFYRFPVPFDAGNRLGLIPSLANLKDNLKPDEVNLDIAIRPRGVTPESIPTRLLGSLRVYF